MILMLWCFVFFAVEGFRVSGFPWLTVWVARECAVSSAGALGLGGFAGFCPKPLNP